VKWYNQQFKGMRELKYGFKKLGVDAVS